MKYGWWNQSKSSLADHDGFDRPQAAPSKKLSTRLLADGVTVPLTDTPADTVRCDANPLAVPVGSSRRRRHRCAIEKQPAWLPMSAVSLGDMVARFDSSEVACSQAARGVFADVALGEYRLRSHALVWAEDLLLNPELDAELSLLLVLSPIANSYLPIGTALTITENNLLHSGQNLQWASNPTCLYTQVFGDWGKQFTVKITLPNGAAVTLPPLTFSRG